MKCLFLYFSSDIIGKESRENIQKLTFSFDKNKAIEGLADIGDLSTISPTTIMTDQAGSQHAASYHDVMSEGNWMDAHLLSEPLHPTRSPSAVDLPLDGDFERTAALFSQVPDAHEHNYTSIMKSVYGRFPLTQAQMNKIVLRKKTSKKI